MHVDCEVLVSIASEHLPPIAALVPLVRESRRVLDAIRTGATRLARRKWQVARAKLAQPALSLRAAYRRLRAPRAQPVWTFVGANGDLVSDPAAVDEVLREAWANVYNGDARGPDAVARCYLQANDPYIFRGDPVVLPAIAGQELADICREAAKTAAGPDGWSPAEWTLLTPAALQHMANMFMAIEAGAAWPADLLLAKTAFLA